uniref:Uncharacterized protein n=1 Tax=Anguilla anguilla TaxID=7936 RepID=A0A0E9QUJ3_ANGAN
MAFSFNKFQQPRECDRVLTLYAEKITKFCTCSKLG